MDRWSDTMNSRTATDAKLERQGHGSSEAAKETHVSALHDMEHLMSNTHKPGVTRRPGPASTRSRTPIQRGIIKSSSSHCDPYADLKSAYPGEFRYLLSDRLNQDCMHRECVQSGTRNGWPRTPAPNRRGALATASNADRSIVSRGHLVAAACRRG